VSNSDVSNSDSGCKKNRLRSKIEGVDIYCLLAGNTKQDHLHRDTDMSSD
jgi:hypothetical protein